MLCLKPLNYQCRKCKFRGSKIGDKECNSFYHRTFRKRKLIETIYDRNGYEKNIWLEQCILFKPLSEKTCKHCDKKYSCITS